MDEKQLPDESTGQMPPLEIDEVQNLPTEQEASTPSPESSDAPVEESLLDEDDLLWLENLISNPESTNEIQAD